MMHDNSHIDKLTKEMERLKIKYRYLENEYKVLKDESELNAEQYYLILSDMQAEEKKRMDLEKKLNQAQKMEAIGLLAGGIAHDFNNLLTIIQGYSEIVLNTVKPDNPIYPKLEHIAKASDRAKGLTLQLLTFSRKQIIQAEVIDLQEILKDMDAVLDSICGDNISLSIDIKILQPFIKADPTQMQQIIMNLMINARDAMPKGGRVSITIDEYLQKEDDKSMHLAPGKYVSLVVEDTGEGIPKAYQAKIFDPFFTTKDVGKGTGLGLPTVYGIVKQFKGYIDFQSETGVGTTFSLFFPQSEKTVEKNKILEEKVIINSEIKKTILVVEDEQEVRELVKSALELNGFNVLIASDGKNGIEKYQQNYAEIDMIISDLIMPEVSGEEMVQEIRKTYQKEIKVLFMSGFTADMIAEKGILKPNTHFIQKPFKLKKLIEKIYTIFQS